MAASNEKSKDSADSRTLEELLAESKRLQAQSKQLSERAQVLSERIERLQANVNKRGSKK